MTIFPPLVKFILSVPLDYYGYNNTITNVLWCIFYLKLWLYTMRSDFKPLKLLFLYVWDAMVLADATWWQKTEQYLNPQFGYLQPSLPPVKEVFVPVSWVLQWVGRSWSGITKRDLLSTANKWIKGPWGRARRDLTANVRRCILSVLDSPGLWITRIL